MGVSAPAVGPGGVRVGGRGAQGDVVGSPLVRGQVCGEGLAVQQRQVRAAQFGRLRRVLLPEGAGGVGLALRVGQHAAREVQLRAQGLVGGGQVRGGVLQGGVRGPVLAQLREGLRAPQLHAGDQGRQVPLARGGQRVGVRLRGATELRVPQQRVPLRFQVHDPQVRRAAPDQLQRALHEGLRFLLRARLRPQDRQVVQAHRDLLVAVHGFVQVQGAAQMLFAQGGVPQVLVHGVQREVRARPFQRVQRLGRVEQHLGARGRVLRSAQAQQRRDLQPRAVGPL
ncbi:hypothetical protein ACMT4L_09780 [Deinococcus sp. A31D244]|uniref:hypothetical protein n=1 Tax=Deinococcus sp. A31D244 TaxID=3397675 RepID=UPI0039DF8F85